MKRKLYLIVMIAIILVGLIALKKEDSVTIVAVGDILLDRGVGDKLEEMGYDYPYENVGDILRSGDITIGNLEGPIYEGENPAYKRPSLIFKGKITNGEALKKAGFDIVNLANNHTMDYKRQGLIRTMEVLKDYGMKGVGGGHNYNQAREPLIVSRNNMRIGFLSYSVFPPEGYIALPEKPDIARVDDGKLSDEIKKAKEKCDFLILSFHWGNEYHKYPSEAQKSLGHKAIDYGGDMVIGHHPHVLQEEEVYKGKYIFYSLGNFVFDKQIHKGTDETIILKIKIKDGKLNTFEKIPVKIEQCQPRIVGSV